MMLERDAVALDPKHYSVDLENERVRVVRMKYGGGEKSVMHQHPPGIAIFITDAAFKFTYPDGDSEHFLAKAGEFIYFSDIWEHQPENSTDEPMEAIYVELR